ncbi:MAG: VirB8/TrbF family protein [Phycisphaerales bacterium]|nr:VirB8/TrbF family protein [Phycisphaerales bacterium]
MKSEQIKKILTTAEIIQRQRRVLYLFSGAMVIGFICFAIFNYVMFKTALNEVRIIDKVGNVYNSHIESYDRSTAVQIRGFVYQFAILLFNYNYKNIDQHVKAVQTLADDNLKIFLQQNINLYREVKSLRGISDIDRDFLASSIQIIGSTFTATIKQNITIGDKTINNEYTMTGSLAYSGVINVINPFGLFINNIKIQ